MIISDKEYEELLAYKWSFKLITDPKFPISETMAELEDSFINDMINDIRTENIAALIITNVNTVLNNKITIIK